MNNIPPRAPLDTGGIVNYGPGKVERIFINIMFLALFGLMIAVLTRSVGVL